MAERILLGNIKGEKGDKGDTFKFEDLTVDNLTLMPQSSKPTKNGFLTNTDKVIHKNSNDELHIYQNTNNGYLKYVYKRNTGGFGSGDYGGDHELLRLISVKSLDNVIVYISPKENVSGSVERVWQSNFPQVASLLFFDLPVSLSEVGRGLFDHLGLDKNPQIYAINDFASYTVTPDRQGKVKLDLYDRGSASFNTEFDVSFNNSVVYSGSTQSIGRTGKQTLSVDVKSNISGELKITNKGTGQVFIGALNMCELKHDNHKQFSDVITYASEHSVNFIDSNGANDYAIRLASTGKLMGSYHGGEKSNALTVIKNGKKVNFEDVAVNDLWIEKDFAIFQETTLIDLIDMNSVNSFNTDGSVDMEFSMNTKNNSPIDISTYWVALTCTNTMFNKVVTPIKLTLPDTPSNTHMFFDKLNGHVVQTTPNGDYELHSRFDTFLDNWVGDEKSSSISDNQFYRKHYYAPIRNYTGGVPLKSFQSTKSLDFYKY